MAKERRPGEMEVFLAAVDIPDPGLRQAYLDLACANDPRLRSSVERLLQHHARAGGFLESPAVKLVSPDEFRTRAGASGP